MHETAQWYELHIYSARVDFARSSFDHMTDFLKDVSCGLAATKLNGIA